MKLLIRNLPRTMTQAEVKEMVEALGTVQSCNLVMDPKNGVSKGFAFVEMPKPGQAKAAIKVLNGQEMDGNRIRVKKAEPKSGDAEDEATAKPSVWKGKS